MSQIDNASTQGTLMNTRAVVDEGLRAWCTFTTTWRVEFF
jgi:hypothetical protein